MKICVRRGVYLAHPESLAGPKGVPIELALPYEFDEFKAGMNNLPAVAEYVGANDVAVYAVHATQGDLSGDDFMEWALPTVRFAESIGVPVVVFHPENVPAAAKADLQKRAIANLKNLNAQTSITAAIETFNAPENCLITTKEMMDLKLPMILDTSHFPMDGVFEVIGSYSDRIAGLHLSEVRGDGEETSGHHPVESYGFDVLKKLKELGWKGHVTLEYLPRYQNRIVSDRQKLEEMFS